QSTAELRGHRGIRVLRVAAPMEWIALTPRPGAPRPDDAVASFLFRDVEGSGVVSKRIEVVLVPTRFPGVIEPFRRRSFAEVDLDRPDAHVEQRTKLRAVPRDRRWIAEVEHRIVGTRPSALIADRESLIDQLLRQRILRRVVGVL